MWVTLRDFIQHEILAEYERLDRYSNGDSMQYGQGYIAQLMRIMPGFVGLRTGNLSIGPPCSPQWFLLTSI